MPLNQQPNAVPSDDDLFPFGVHKAKRYGDVPAKYLDFIDGQPWIDQWPAVKAYIAKNRKAIDRDLDLV